MNTKATTISTFFAENNAGRAEVKQYVDSYFIEYYDGSGEYLSTETFSNKSIFYVEDAAENWALGIKQLNG